MVNVKSSLQRDHQEQRSNGFSKFHEQEPGSYDRDVQHHNAAVRGKHQGDGAIGTQTAFGNVSPPFQKMHQQQPKQSKHQATVHQQFPGQSVIG